MKISFVSSSTCPYPLHSSMWQVRHRNAPTGTITDPAGKLLPETTIIAVDNADRSSSAKANRTLPEGMTSPSFR